MNLKKYFTKTLVSILIFNLIFTNTAQALTAIEANARTIDVIIDMTKSGKPSDLPVAGVSDFFEKENVHLVQNFDLSALEGQKVFVGYGIYDKAQDNCKFIEKPGLSKIDYDGAFPKKDVFNEHSYGVSNVPMSYSSCIALGAQYGGYPISIDSASENYFLSGTFTNITISSNGIPTPINNVWVGAKRLSCDDPKYTNELNRVQDLEFWKTKSMGNVCEPNKLNVKIDKTSQWTKTDLNTNSFCVIEFDHKDYTKPFKICAPWWKIIREYPNTDHGLYNTQELKRINQADIPIQILMCTKYDTDLIVTPPDQQIHRKAYCTEYYDRTVAPECILNNKQAICKVNECGGYIANTCTLQASDTVGKGYVKGEVLISGIMTEVKVKEDIITHEYLCPPSPPGSRHCIEESAVVVYPKECPGSTCTALKECIYSARSDKTRIDNCYITHPCVKIYGSRDIPPLIDPNTREVTKIYGKCPDAPVSDGSMLEFPVNIEKKMGKVCEEYEELKDTKQIVQNCKLERPFTDYQVDMSLSQVDEYEGNPLCLRMDTVINSLAMHTIAMTIKSKGFFKSKLTKVYLDDTILPVYSGGSDIYVLAGAVPILDGYNRSVNSTDNATLVTEELNVTTTPLDLDCSPYQITENEDGTTNPNAWVSKNIDLWTNGAIPNLTKETAFNLIDYSGPGTKGIITVNMTDHSATTCTALASRIGATSTYVFNASSGNGICTLSKSKVGVDNDLSSMENITLDQTISADNMKFKYIFKNAMSKIECTKRAYCLNGIFNDTSFTNGDNICEVTNGDVSSQTEYFDAIKVASGIPLPVESNPNNTDPVILTRSGTSPTPSEESASATLNGVENIFIIEEYISGGWGNYSNYNEWDPLSNEIKISTSEFTDKNLLIPEMTKITDYLHYNGIYKHESHKAKKPDVATAVGGGLAVGGAIAAVMIYNAGLAALTTTALTGAAAGTVTAAVTSAAASGVAATTSTGTIMSAGLTMGPVGWAVVVILVVILILLVVLAATKNMDRQHTEYHIYKDVPIDFWHLGPYETRFKEEKALVPGEKSNHLSDIPGFMRMTYFHNMSDTGRDEPGPFLEMLKKILQQKQQIIVSAGIEYSEVDRITHADERTINYPYPECPWYKPSCTKQDNHYKQIVTNGQLVVENIPTTTVPLLPGYNSYSVEKVHKTMSNMYIGAVNTLIVLVPYAGDYELKALNRENHVLSTRIIHEASFAGLNTALDLKTAQVNFGMNMQIYNGREDGLNDKACRKDRATEWGGGVSGVFFETQRTDESKSCYRSDENYLKANSMTTIQVRPLNMDRGFTYLLTRPMPFPNRVWITTLDDREIRNYRCFEDWPDCADSSFKEVK